MQKEKKKRFHGLSIYLRRELFRIRVDGILSSSLRWSGVAPNGKISRHPVCTYTARHSASGSCDVLLVVYNNYLHTLRSRVTDVHHVSTLFSLVYYAVLRLPLEYVTSSRVTIVIFCSRTGKITDLLYADRHRANNESFILVERFRAGVTPLLSLRE